MNYLILLNAAGGAPGVNLPSIIIMYGAIIGIFWFFIMRPQKKKEKAHNALISSVGIGDNVLTTGGFYGVVIDVSDEVVVVEFGSNKNCRIPMKKEAIVEIEKANAPE